MSEETRKLTPETRELYESQENLETRDNPTRKLTDDEVNAKYAKKVLGNPADIKYSCRFVGRNMGGVLSGEELPEWLRQESIKAGIGFVEAASSEYVVPLTNCTNLNALSFGNLYSGNHTVSRSKGIKSRYVPASSGEERCALAPYCNLRYMTSSVPQGPNWKRNTLLPVRVTGQD